jgi:hypothetical protein
MFSLTFTEGLVFFMILQTLLYIIILFSTSNKNVLNEKNERPPFNVFTGVLIKSICILLLFMSVFLIDMSPYKDSLFFQFTYTVVFATLVITIISTTFGQMIESKLGAYLFILAMVFHIVTLLNSWDTYQFPFPAMGISERTGAVAKLLISGYWNPNSGMLNPTYNPLPADIVGKVFLSTILGLSPNAPILDFIWCTILILGFDVSIYLLIKYVTRDILATFLSILLVATTPPLNIVAHMPRSTAILLILVSLVFLAQFSKLRSQKAFGLILLLYSGAIFYHLMAVQIFFVLESFITVLWVLSSMKIVEKAHEHIKIEFLHILSMLFVIIALIKLLWASQAISQIVNPLITLVNNLFNIQQVPEVSTSNYERNVTFIHAYSWTTMPALATAFVVYLLNRLKSHNVKIKVEYLIALAFYVAGVSLLLVGFFSALTGSGFHPDIYPSTIFVLPASSFALSEISRRQRLASLTLLLCFAIGSWVSIKDPMLNMQCYTRMSSAADVPAGVSNWYIEANVLTHVVNPKISIFSTYEMNSYFSYQSIISTIEYTFFAGSADDRRAELQKIEKSGMIRENVLYIWPKWWPLGIYVIEHVTRTGGYPNVLYNSGRYIVFIGCVKNG